MTATKEAPAIYGAAQKLLADRQRWHPGGDYRWVIGQDFIREILLLGVSIAASDDWDAELKARAEGWKKYPYLHNHASDLAEFCSLPALFMGNIQPNVAILLRDGVPCGAIHCEAVE